MTACTTYNTGIKAVGEAKVQIDIRKGDATMYELCEDWSVGEVRRRFGNDMTHYNGICDTYKTLKFNKE